MGRNGSILSHIFLTQQRRYNKCALSETEAPERDTRTSARVKGATKCVRKTQSSYLLHYIFGIAINNHTPLSASPSSSFSTSVWELMNNKNIILKLARAIYLKIDAGSCWPLSPSPASCTSLAVCMPLQVFSSVCQMEMKSVSLRNWSSVSASSLPTRRRQKAKTSESMRGLLALRFINLNSLLYLTLLISLIILAG